MNPCVEETDKQTVVAPWETGQKVFMAENEHTGMVVGKAATGSDYVISNGIVAPGGANPEHHHKREDQTFHVIAGTLEARTGGETPILGPGDRAEDFMAETSRQNRLGAIDLPLIEARFGVVYL